jgi:hypothetical protein
MGSNKSILVLGELHLDGYIQGPNIPLDMPLDGFPVELFDHVQILVNSFKSGKYPMNNWLERNGKGCDNKSMYASIFRHVSAASNGIKLDKDSKMDHRLHAAIRLMMDYTRDQKGLNEKFPTFKEIK